MATLAHLNVLLGLEARAFVKAIDGAQRRLKRFGRNAERMGRSMMTGLTVPILAVGTAATKTALDFDSAMLKIGALVGASREQVAAWRNELLAMAGQVGIGPTELARALYDVSSAGIEGTAAIDTVRAAAQAASVGLGDTAVVADAVTSVLNAYGTANITAAEATAILVGTVREGKRPADELAGVFGDLLPFATELGISFDQLGGAIAHLSRTGLTGSAAASQLKNIMGGLIGPTVAAHANFELFETSAAKLKKIIREEGLLAAMIELRTRFGENTEALKKSFKSLEAVGGILTLTRNKGAEAAKIMGAMAKVTGQDLVTAVERTQGPMLELQKAWAGIRAAAIRFGDAILPIVIPAMKALGEFITKVAEGFAKLPKPVQQAALAMAALAAAAGPILVIVGATAIGLASIGVGALAWGAAIAAASALVMSQFDSIAAGAKKLFEFMKPALSDVAAFIVTQWEKVREWTVRIWPSILDTVRNVIDLLVGLWSIHGETISRGVAVTWALIKRVISTALDVVLGVIEVGLHLLAGNWGKAWEAIKNTALKVWGSIGDIFKAGGLTIQAAMRGMAAGIVETVTAGLEQLQKFALAASAAFFLQPAMRTAALAAYDAIGGQIGKLTGEAQLHRAEQALLIKEAKDLLAPITDAKDELVEMRGEWVTVRGEIRKTATEAQAIFGNATDAMVGQLQGGFGKASDGILETFRKVVLTIEGTTIEARVVPIVDSDIYYRQLEEMGAAPDTSGSLP